ncbi:hypothetical protein [Prochlorococcus marinus]|uniref:hypothetical protein n=1 Tax=Prochlorococcus marinus TaxID=1219 RepID=UPI0022B54694|nr:hypothetical protein [Prochlorococcus marinus]
MHWRSLFARIVEKPMNNPAGIAKLAIIVASLIPYMVKGLLMKQGPMNLMQELVQVSKKELET